MDPISGIAAFQKATGGIRALPGWLLAWLLLSVTVVLMTPLRQEVPEGIARWFPLAIVLLTMLVLCKLGSGVAESLSERRANLLVRDRQRLDELYRPLAMLFLTRHVTTCTGVGAPRLRQRLANAIEEFGAYRRRRVGMRRAWQALFDARSSTSAQVEYGGSFPMERIADLTRIRSAIADPALLDLVRRADRSRYESNETELLTDEERSLFEHIDSMHQRLSKLST